MSMQLSLRNTKSSQNRELPFSVLHPAQRPPPLPPATQRIPRPAPGRHLLPAGGEVRGSGAAGREQEQLEGAGEMDDLRDARRHSLPLPSFPPF